MGVGRRGDGPRHTIGNYPIRGKLLYLDKKMFHLFLHIQNISFSFFSALGLIHESLGLTVKELAPGTTRPDLMDNCNDLFIHMYINNEYLVIFIHINNIIMFYIILFPFSSYTSTHSRTITCIYIETRTHTLTNTLVNTQIPIINKKQAFIVPQTFRIKY